MKRLYTAKVKRILPRRANCGYESHGDQCRRKLIDTALEEARRIFCKDVRLGSADATENARSVGV
jgi:hypothetical protein